LIKVGDRIGRLVVIADEGMFQLKSVNRARRLLCRCDCGTEKSFWVASLRGSSSCGCYKSEWASQNARVHGASGTKEHRALKGMIQRCHNPKNHKFAAYGGRGIAVYEGWRGRDGFGNFIAHVGPCPHPSASIDRIDTDGNYEPGNVRWASTKEQGINRRRTMFVEVDGERLCLKDACAKVGAPYLKVYYRFKRGLPFTEAVGPFV